MATDELDALDRQVAELLGWRWGQYQMAENKVGIWTGMGENAECDHELIFQPTRDARQAEVLREELIAAHCEIKDHMLGLSLQVGPVVALGHYYVLGDSPDTWFKGETGLVRLVRAFIAWRGTKKPGG